MAFMISSFVIFFVVFRTSVQRHINLENQNSDESSAHAAYCSIIMHCMSDACVWVGIVLLTLHSSRLAQGEQSIMHCRRVRGVPMYEFKLCERLFQTAIDPEDG